MPLLQVVLCWFFTVHFLKFFLFPFFLGSACSYNQGALGLPPPAVLPFEAPRYPDLLLSKGEQRGQEHRSAAGFCFSHQKNKPSTELQVSALLSPLSLTKTSLGLDSVMGL